MGLQQVCCRMQNNEVGVYLVPYAETNSKYIKDLSVKAEAFRRKHGSLLSMALGLERILRYDTTSMGVGDGKVV